MGFSRQEHQWVAMPSSRGSSRPRDRTRVFCITGCSLLASGFFVPGSPSHGPLLPHPPFGSDLGTVFHLCLSDCLYVCVSECVCVCVCVCVHACVFVCMYACVRFVYKHVCACICVHLYACMCFCMFLSECTSVHVLACHCGHAHVTA